MASSPDEDDEFEDFASFASAATGEAQAPAAAATAPPTVAAAPAAVEQQPEDDSADIDFGSFDSAPSAVPITTADLAPVVVAASPSASVAQPLVEEESFPDPDGDDLAAFATTSQTNIAETPAPDPAAPTAAAADADDDFGAFDSVTVPATSAELAPLEPTPTAAAPTATTESAFVDPEEFGAFAASEPVTTVPAGAAAIEESFIDPDASDSFPAFSPPPPAIVPTAEAAPASAPSPKSSSPDVIASSSDGAFAELRSNPSTSPPLPSASPQPSPISPVTPHGGAASPAHEEEQAMQSATTAEIQPLAPADVPSDESALDEFGDFAPASSSSPPIVEPSIEKTEATPEPAPSASPTHIDTADELEAYLSSARPADIPAADPAEFSELDEFTAFASPEATMIAAVEEKSPQETTVLDAGVDSLVTSSPAVAAVQDAPPPTASPAASLELDAPSPDAAAAVEPEEEEDFGSFDTAASSPEVVVPAVSSAAVAAAASVPDFIDPDAEEDGVGAFGGSSASVNEAVPAAKSPAMAEPAFIDPDGDDDESFGDFSSQAALAAPVPSPAVAMSAPAAAADASASSFDDEEFGDFDSFASAAPAAPAAVTTSAPANDAMAADEDEWGSFDSTTTAAAPAPAPVAAAVPLTAADMHGSGAVAEAVTLWKLDASARSTKLDVAVSSIFGGKSSLSSSSPALLPPLANTVSSRGPYLSGSSDLCAACGGAFPRTHRAQRLCVYCGRGLPVNLPPIAPFKNSLIYTNLFDALGVSPPSLPPASPTNVTGDPNGDDATELGGAASSSANIVPVQTPSPQPMMRGGADGASASSAAAAAAAQQSGAWPNGASSVPQALSHTALDFFASGGSTGPVVPPGDAASKQPPAHKQKTNSLTPSTQGKNSSSTSGSKGKGKTQAQDEDDDGFGSFNSTSNSTTAAAASTTAASAAADSLDWLNDASSSNAAAVPSTTSNGVGAASEEDSEDDFADFSSAPQAGSGAPADLAPSPTPSTSPQFSSHHLSAFTVTPAKPTKGEVALKRLKELVAVLPDLTFLARASV